MGTMKIIEETMSKEDLLEILFTHHPPRPCDKCKTTISLFEAKLYDRRYKWVCKDCFSQLSNEEEKAS